VRQLLERMGQVVPLDAVKWMDIYRCMGKSEKLAQGEACGRGIHLKGLAP
jgi:hypothetical protein